MTPPARGTPRPRLRHRLGLIAVVLAAGVITQGCGLGGVEGVPVDVLSVDESAAPSPALPVPGSAAPSPAPSVRGGAAPSAASTQAAAASAQPAVVYTASTKQVTCKPGPNILTAARLDFQVIGERVTLDLVAENGTTPYEGTVAPDGTFVISETYPASRFEVAGSFGPQSVQGVMKVIFSNGRVCAPAFTGLRK